MNGGALTPPYIGSFEVSLSHTFQCSTHLMAQRAEEKLGPRGAGEGETTLLQATTDPPRTVPQDPSLHPAPSALIHLPHSAGST